MSQMEQHDDDISAILRSSLRGMHKTTAKLLFPGNFPHFTRRSKLESLQGGELKHAVVSCDREASPDVTSIHDQ